mgnify:CR=1 FL=1
MHLQENLSINFHAVPSSNFVITRQSFDRDIFLHIFLADNPLVQISSGATGEAVVALLLRAVVGFHVVAEQLGGLVLLDHTHVDIATRAQIVEDTSLDCLGADVDGTLSVQVWLPGRLKHRHRSQRSRAHRHIRQLVCRSVCVHSVQASAGRVHACNNQVRSDVALVPEEVLLEHRHTGDHTGVAAR